jgi:hypothetical protein
MAAQTTKPPAIPTPPAPLLNAPADKASEWLFNSGQSFSWSIFQADKKATYVIVVSEKIDFAGYRDTNGVGTCDNSCVTTVVRTNSASKTGLSNFWWKGRDYFWKVKTMTSTGLVGPWSNSWRFSPTSHPGISSAAYNTVMAGSDAPASIPGSPWVTDYSGDGPGMKRTATVLATWVTSKEIGGYDKWVKLGKPVISKDKKTDIKALMLLEMKRYTSYNDTERASTVDRMIARYTGTIPAGEGEMLTFLGIRAQCKEFADRMVLQGAGKTKVYGLGKESAGNYRPSMYAFKNDNSHSAIITEVQWDANGNPSGRIAQSNAGSGLANPFKPTWKHPGGQTPWERTIDLSVVSLKEFYAANTDKE